MEREEKRLKGESLQRPILKPHDSTLFKNHLSDARLASVGGIL